MKTPRILLIALCVLIAQSISAQKGILKQANKYFEAAKYAEAFELYNQLKADQLDKDIYYKRGVANYYLHHPEAALQDLTQAKSLGYEEEEIYLYAAKTLHSQNKFVEASEFYKNYLRFVEDEQEVAQIIQCIKRCKFGYDNQFNDQVAFVENLGSSVNTEYDEIKPVQSPTSQNKYYFSSNRSGSHGGLRNAQGYKDEIYGSYSADMYAVELSGGNWTAVSAFHPILNGPKNDIIEGFNPDGSVMYFLKSHDGKTGQIFADTFSVDKDPEAFPKQFESPVITELGDKDLQVFNNNTLIFSSKRDGGYGGYDLYVSEKKEGHWQAPHNLGPEINTAFDESSPFLAKSGKKLYFSSNGLNSFGGFDIYVSEYESESGKWKEPENLGLPINSSKDDVSLTVSADGMTAIFSSDRVDSYGGSDLYLAYFKDQVMDQLMYTEELSFLQEPADSDEEGEEVKADPSNAAEDDTAIRKKEFFNSPLYYGSDEIILNPENASKMDGVKDLMSIFPELNVTLSGHSTQEGMREFDLYFSIKRAEKAAEYLIEEGVAATRIYVKGMGSNFPHTKQKRGQINRLAEKNNRRIDITFSNIPNNRLTIIQDRPSVLETLEDERFATYFNTIQGLAYMIKIAETKQMFKADVIRIYDSGVVQKWMNDDSYTYTIGVMERYSEARNLKRELIRKGIIDAKVLPYINGQPVSTGEVPSFKDQYPDLNEFLRFESE